MPKFDLEVPIIRNSSAYTTEEQTKRKEDLVTYLRLILALGEEASVDWLARLQKLLWHGDHVERTRRNRELRDDGPV